MDFIPETRKKLSHWLIGIAAACILIFLGVQNIGIVADAVTWVFQLFFPLVLGGAIALILNVPMRWFESKLWPKSQKEKAVKFRSPAAYVLSLIMILDILVGIVWLVIPELAAAMKLLAQSAVDFINSLNQMEKAEIAELPFGKYLLEVDWNILLQTLQNWLKNQSSSIVTSVVGSVSALISGVYTFFMSFIFSIYLLFGKEKLAAQICRLVRVWLPNNSGAWLIHANSVLSENFRNFISGQTLEAVILGTLCMVGMWILQIPYAPMVGALVGVTALIPVVGGFIGAAVGAFMILTVAPIKAVIFIVFLLILQQLEGNLIYPRVMGSRVNLPAMWILAAVTVGGNLAGAPGMLLSVPLASSAYILLREATEKREQQAANS